MELFTKTILLIAFIGYFIVYFTKFNYHEPVGWSIIIGCYVALYTCKDLYKLPSTLITIAGIIVVALMFYDEYRKIKFDREWRKMNDFAEKYRDKFEKH